MNLKDFKAAFDEHMKDYIQNKINLSKNILNHKKLNNFMDYFFDYVFQGGKRTRPYVLFLCYKSFGGQEDTEILRFGVIIELIHTMALIHDDIIDQADKRHNVATMHHYIASQIGTENMHIAEGQAILFGDLVLSRVYELQNKSFNFDEKLLAIARDNIHTMIEELILGQMIDVDTMTGEELSEEHLEKKTLYKSAKYSFSRPMTTGAILAGAKQEQIRLIENLGIQMGLAYQVRDDLMDLVAHDTSKSIFSDIQEGQQTVFTQYIYQRDSEENKTLLRSCMGQNLNNEQISQLKTMLQTSGAIDYGKDLIKKYGTQAISILEQIEFTDTNYKGAFEQLIKKIVSIKI